MREHKTQRESEICLWSQWYLQRKFGGYFKLFSSWIKRQQVCYLQKFASKVPNKVLFLLLFSLPKLESISRCSTQHISFVTHAFFTSGGVQNTLIGRWLTSTAQHPWWNIIVKALFQMSVWLMTTYVSDLCFAWYHFNPSQAQSSQWGIWSNNMQMIFFFFLTFNHNYELHLHDVDFYLIVSQPQFATCPADDKAIWQIELNEVNHGS